MGAQPSTSSRAIVALVLGIVGIVLCPLTAPFAWVLGRRAEAEVDASGGAIAGRGLATAGKITGIVGVVLLVVYVLVLIVLVIGGIVISEDGGGTVTTEILP
jgi:hypothetical protein